MPIYQMKSLSEQGVTQAKSQLEALQTWHLKVEDIMLVESCTTLTNAEGKPYEKALHYGNPVLFEYDNPFKK
jgi:hypothetical protein